MKHRIKFIPKVDVMETAYRRMYKPNLGVSKKQRLKAAREYRLKCAAANDRLRRIGRCDAPVIRKNHVPIKDNNNFILRLAYTAIAFIIGLKKIL